MPTTETIEKQNECTERVRNSRGIDWEAVASRLRAVREKVPGNATTADKRAHCCGLQEWARILWPDEDKNHTKISQLERGKQTPDLDTLLRYAAAGGVSLEWLLYGEEEKKEGSPATLRDFAKVISNMMSPLNISIEISPSDEEVKAAKSMQYCIIKFPYRHYSVNSISGNDDLNTVCNGGSIARPLLQLFKFHQLCEHLEHEKMLTAYTPDIGYDEKILSSFYTFVHNGKKAILETIPDIHDENAIPLPFGLNYVFDPYGNRIITNMTQEEYISELKAARKRAATIADDFK